MYQSVDQFLYMNLNILKPPRLFQTNSTNESLAFIYYLDPIMHGLLHSEP